MAAAFPVGNRLEEALITTSLTNKIDALAGTFPWIVTLLTHDAPPPTQRGK
jgi:hypothetical protein